MTICRQKNPVSRFNKPAYETLVSWINEKNNRGFDLKQFNFSGVTPLADDGSARITFNFDKSTGWEQGDQTLVVQRVNLSLLPGLNGIVIHSPEFTKSTILACIFEQYGLYLDMDLVNVIPGKMPLSKAILNKYLDGFDEAPENNRIYDNADIYRNYTIEISDIHPTLTGTVPLYVRKSLKDLIGFMSPTLNLREYYIEGRTDLPYVETLQPGGMWMLDKVHYPDIRKMKDIQNHLNAFKACEVISDDKVLLSIITQLSKFNWVTTDEVTGFNLRGAKVIYNGLTDPVVNRAPIEYTHLLVIELSELCNNLQGELKIAYQYASPHHPTNTNRAGFAPLGYFKL